MHRRVLLIAVAAVLAAGHARAFDDQPRAAASDRVAGGATAPATRARLMLPSPPMALSVDGDRLYAGLGLEGSAFMVLGADGEPTLASVRRDLPSTFVLPLSPERVLLAGRNSELMLVCVKRPEAPEMLARWPVEGIPNSILRTGNLLVVASGAAGVLVYEWDGQDGSDPRLRGRYPFVDYSKEVRLGPGGLVFLADTYDTGLQVLDVSEPHRPRRVLGQPMGDFVDGVAVGDDYFALALRRSGIALFPTAGEGGRRATVIPSVLQARSRVLEVHAAGRGYLAAAEMAGGATLVRIESAGPEGVRARRVEVLSGGEIRAVALAVGREGAIYVGGEDGSVLLWRPKALQVGISETPSAPAAGTPAPGAGTAPNPTAR